MSERAYFGVSPSSFATPGDRYRLAFRDVLGLLGGIRDPQWPARTNRFLEVLPGSTQLAFAFPPAASDDVARCAVVDVQLMSHIPALPVSQIMDRIEGAFPDTQLLRVRKLEAAQSAIDRATGQAGELAAVVARDVELDAQGGGPLDWLRGLGLWVVVVLGLLLGIVYYAKRQGDS